MEKEKQYSNYDLWLYTEYAFGRGRANEVGELVTRHGGHKVMIVYSGGSIKKTGLFGRVTASLEAAGHEWVEFGGAKPNPVRSHVDKGIELAKQTGTDFYLGVGGGSAIDTAKCIAFGLQDGTPDWYPHIFSSWAGHPKAKAPFGTILTAAAAGAEGSTSMMMVDDIDKMDKFGSGGKFARPLFTILDPELTFTVSKFQTAAGAVDMFAHTLERYFPVEGRCCLGDEFAAGQMRTVVKYAPIACEEPENYEARAELMLCGCFGHNDITVIGHPNPGRRGGPHYLEGCISGKYDATHGAGLAVIMPHWLKYTADFSEEACRRVAKFAIQVWGVLPDPSDPKTVAYEGIRRMRAWLRDLGMPSTLTQLGIKEENIPDLMNHCMWDENDIHHGYVPFTRDQMRKFYQECL